MTDAEKIARMHAHFDDLGALWRRLDVETEEAVRKVLEEEGQAVLMRLVRLGTSMGMGAQEINAMAGQRRGMLS